MSRSIHTTRRTFSQIAKKKFAAVTERSEALDKAQGELRRKRRIKRQVADERRRVRAPLAGSDSKTIPIQMHNVGQYVHHSASVEDLRSVLGLLPAAATEGISSIKLILGKEYIDEEYADEREDRDPFTGRLSCETLPGVYSGVCLGTYAQRSGQIKLHAHVYDADKLPLARNISEFYLKLRALSTFVHEVAHHHDETNRVRRGRWLADRKENVEWYAEKMEHEWTRQFVLPYLERTYPAAAKDLLDFVEHHGGLRVPLEFFAGDSRSTLRNGLIRFAFTTDSAFESWVEELPKCADLAASRLAFAWELHYADNYDDCLRVLERVLAEKPALSPALTCKGDTLIHIERYDEAFAVAERVLTVEPANGDAWEIRGDVFEARQDWSALLENCDSWLAGVPEDSDSRFDAFQHRAVAYCALGDKVRMEMWIDAWANFGNRKRKPELIRKAVFRRAGKELPK
ncbi:MAG: hypothetical protein M9920_08325 [Verrucomicrobiae bacterium]|nr:hypothetical protein [Verrucomicrobiae bacterium]